MGAEVAEREGGADGTAEPRMESERGRRREGPGRTSRGRTAQGRTVHKGGRHEGGQHKGREDGRHEAVNEYVDSFKDALVGVVYNWGKGTHFDEIMRDTDLFEGTVVRCMRRLDELITIIKTLNYF